MTLYQFNMLEDEEEKLASILLNGECIGNRTEGGEEIFYMKFVPFMLKYFLLKLKTKMF